MTPAEKIQAMINGRQAQIDQIEAELNILRELQDEFRGSNGAPGGGRRRDEERHAKLVMALRAVVTGITVADMSEASGYGLSSMKTKIRKMHKAGEVERVSPGRYRLKGAGT